MATQLHVTEIINTLDVIYTSFTKLNDYIVFDHHEDTENWKRFEKFSLEACKNFVESFIPDLTYLADKKLKEKQKN